MPKTAEDLVLLEHTNALHARTVLVDWMLGNACSYACSYCPQSLHDGTVRWQNILDVTGFYQTLLEHYVRYRDRRVWLQFTGGEPTMHPQIIRLLTEANARGFAVSLISNASRTHRFWTKIKPNLDAVILTYHTEFADYDHFSGVCDLLTPDVPIHINVTMRPEVFDATLDDAERLRDAFPNASISLKPLRVGFGTELFDYTSQQKAIMDQGLPGGPASPSSLPRATMTAMTKDGSRTRLRANEMIVRELNHLRGFRCNAGLESLRVTGDGTVFRAVCGVGGPIGKLGDRINLPYAPITCTKDTCGCTADILISKVQTVRRDVSA